MPNYQNLRCLWKNVTFYYNFYLLFFWDISRKNKSKSHFILRDYKLSHTTYVKVKKKFVGFNDLIDVPFASSWCCNCWGAACTWAACPGVGIRAGKSSFCSGPWDRSFRWRGPNRDPRISWRASRQRCSRCARHRPPWQVLQYKKPPLNL